MVVDISWVLEDYEYIVDGYVLLGYCILEGFKFYKCNGYYYIFVFVGGVEIGWQFVFWVKNIVGFYESRVVMV